MTRPAAQRTDGRFSPVRWVTIWPRQGSPEGAAEAFRRAAAGPSAGSWTASRPSAAPAAADCTTSRVGGFTYYNDNDGSSGTSMRIGQFEYYHQATPPRYERQGWEPMAPGRLRAPYRLRMWYGHEE